MKKAIRTIVLTGSLLITVLTFMISCGTDNKIAAKWINPLALQAGEDTMDLSKNPVDEKDGKKEIDSCKKVVLIDSLRRLPKRIDSINVNAFTILRDSALAIGGVSPNHYILALNIIHGLNLRRDTMNVLYQPVFLQKSDTGKFYVKYLPQTHPLYYKYVYKSNPDSSRFELTTDTTCIARYRNHVFFKQPWDSIFTKFDTTNDESGSVQSLIFAFQEIDSILIANKSKRIYLYNAAEYIPFRSKDYLKHAFLLGPDNIKGVAPIFYMKFGNLSHLCPPSCDEHYYDLKN